MFGEVQVPDAVYEELISNTKFQKEAEKIEQCIDVLRNNGRHISGKLYEQLMEKIGK